MNPAFSFHQIMGITVLIDCNSISKSMMITRRLGGGDEVTLKRDWKADDDANKGSA